MTINKYYLYFILLLAICVPTLGPKLYYRLAYARATGYIDGYDTRYIKTKAGAYTRRYPRVVFETRDEKVSFYAPSFIADQTCDGCAVVVLYNRKEPTKAFVNSTLGVFGRDLVWIFPVFFIMTGCFFGPNIIPKYIKLR